MRMDRTGPDRYPEIHRPTDLRPQDKPLGTWQRRSTVVRATGPTRRWILHAGSASRIEALTRRCTARTRSKRTTSGGRRIGAIGPTSRTSTVCHRTRGSSIDSNAEGSETRRCNDLVTVRNGCLGTSDVAMKIPGADDQKARPCHGSCRGAYRGAYRAACPWSLSCRHFAKSWQQGPFKYRAPLDNGA
jgi:hypothetical protein